MYAIRSYYADKFWGLIGTHLPEDEDLDCYAKKILQISTGIEDVYLKQFKTFGVITSYSIHYTKLYEYYPLINNFNLLKLIQFKKQCSQNTIIHCSVSWRNYATLQARYEDLKIDLAEWHRFLALG